jgi:multidrug resistance efflux pump
VSVGRRVRLVVGLVVVLVLAAYLTMVLNARNGRVEGTSASLAAESYPVGTDYSGTVTQQLVKVGDTVTVGQPLFEVQSATLARDLQQGLLDPRRVPYQIKDGGTLVIQATDAGRVESVGYAVGSFVPANSQLGTIQRAGSLYIEAEFVLTAPDYARLPPNATVDVVLPNNDRVSAQAGRVQVRTENGEARTVVDAYSPDLTAATADGLFAVGAPVQATLELRNDGPVTSVTSWLTELTGIRP